MRLPERGDEKVARANQRECRGGRAAGEQRAQVAAPAQAPPAVPRRPIRTMPANVLIDAYEFEREPGPIS